MGRMIFFTVLSISLLIIFCFAIEEDHTGTSLDEYQLHSNDDNLTKEGTITPFHPPTHLNWQKELGGDVSWIHHGADGRTYYTAEDGYLRCVDQKGDEDWRVLLEYSNYMEEPYICANGTSFFILNGYLNRISEDGTVLWELNIHTRADPVLSTFDRTFVIREGEHSIHKVSMEGEVLWTYELEYEMSYNFKHYSHRPRADYNDFRIMETYVIENGEIFFTKSQWREGYENSSVMRLSPDGEMLNEYPLETEAYPRFQPLPDGSILELAGYIESDENRIYRLSPDGERRKLFSSFGFIEIEQFSPDGYDYIVTERIDHVRKWFHLLSVEEERIIDSYEPDGIISIIDVDPEEGEVVFFFVDEDDEIFIGKVGNDLNLLYEFPIEEEDPYYISYIPDDRYITIRNETILHCLDRRGDIIFEYDLDLSETGYHLGYYYQTMHPTYDPDGNIYTFDRDGLICLDDEGALLWRNDPGGVLYADPVEDILGRIIIATRNGRVACMSKQGDILWDHYMDGSVHSTPVITDDGSVLICDIAGELCSLSQNGSLQWNISLHERINKDLRISSDGNMIAVSDNIVYSIKPNGTVNWTHVIADRIRSSPMTDIPGMMVLPTSGNLTCFSEYGTVIWHAPATELDLRSSPVLGPDGFLYVGGRDIGIFDIDGNPRRTITLESHHRDIEYLAFSEDGRILAVEDHGDLTSYWPNGTMSWTLDTESTKATKPMVDSSGNIIFKSFSLYCLSPDGDILWRYVPSHSRASTSLTGSRPVLMDNGDIVFCHSKIISLNQSGVSNTFEPPEIRDLELNENSLDFVWEFETPPDGTMVDGYRIYHSDDGTKPTPLLEISHLWGFLDGSKDLPTGYYFVSSFNSNGGSDLAGPVVISTWERPWYPDPPENITLDEGYDYIEISWDPPEDDGGSPITNYLIFRSDDRENYTLIAKPGPDSGSYRDSGLDPNRWYYYRIGAENEEGYRFNETVFHEYTYYDRPIDNVPVRVFTVCGLPLILFISMVVGFYFYLKKNRKTGPVWHDGGPVDFSKGGEAAGG